jgi:hypothetical protein
MRDTSVREALTQEQWDHIFHGCPAAWAGNKPERNQPGSIVIDGNSIVDAVRYLKPQSAPCNRRKSSAA